MDVVDSEREHEDQDNGCESGSAGVDTLADQVRRVVDDLGPLTDEQRAVLGLLLGRDQ
ncbi:hypothetical protein [Actinomadura sp. SCN-SB]|uniref:hypothetical protein n=1 Tax=Actinomadura sp. SCN-SB TaxID=3373092 RepID=UPI003752FAC8